MDFFEKIGKKATEAYKATAEKTTQVSNDIKCKMRIEKLKGEINENYEEIGKKVYGVHKTPEVDVRRITDVYCEKIDKLLAEIEEVKKGNLDTDSFLVAEEKKETIITEVIGEEKKEEKEVETSSAESTES